MGNRYKPIAIVAGLLFLVSLVTQIINRTTYDKNVNDQENVTLVFLAVLGVVMAIVSYRWTIRFALSRVVPDMLLIVVFGCIATVLINPLLTGISPFHDGAGDFFERIWIYFGIGLGGAVFGWLVALALGRDHRAQALKRFTATATARPRKVVRR
jgi:membrane associated rhomboid family serine protease